MTPQKRQPRSEIGEESRDRIMAFARDYQRRVGMAPTISEIAARTGLSATGVRYHLNVLVSLGMAERDNRARSLRLIEEAS